MDGPGFVPGTGGWVETISGEADAVLFDATRIVSRRRSRIPTGIDRIDLRLARAFLDAFGPDCRFVAKVRKRAVMVDRALAASLIEALEAAWFGGGEPDLRLALKLEFAGVADGFGVAPPLQRRSLPVRRLWLGLVALRGWITALSRPAGKLAVSLAQEGRTAYVVASHAGLPRIRGALATLKSAGVHRFHAYIHDIIPIDYPEYARPGHAEILQNYLAELAGVGAAFVANSKDTASRLTQLAGRFGWTIGDVPVVYPESGPLPARAAGMRGKASAADGSAAYFVVVGTIEPRKNHLLLLNIWRDLALSGQDPMPHLHIVGRRGWENENVLDMLDRCLAIRPHVTEHADLPDRDLQRLLRGARALLMPSFAEGFGLPVLEALQLGVPVIASDLPVFREIAGNGVDYLDPLDAAGWKQAIQHCAGGHPSRFRMADAKHLANSM